MEFIIVNGHVTKKNDAEIETIFSEQLITFTQKVWFGFGGIPLLHENITIIKEQLLSIGFASPELFDTERELFRRCKRMLNKNKLFRSGFLVFTFFTSNKHVEYIITPEKKDIFNFPILSDGLLVTISDFIKSPYSNLSKLAIHNKVLWKTAESKHCVRLNSGAILVNNEGAICEGIASNLFLVKNNVLMTPSLLTGCYSDTFREIVLKQALSLNLKIKESEEIKPDQFLEADEAFFISEARGIEWILGIGNKRFVHNYSTLLHEQINWYLEDKSRKQ